MKATALHLNKYEAQVLARPFVGWQTPATDFALV